MTCRVLREADIRTTQDDFENLWAVLDKARSTTVSVSVNKDALTRLLMDHSDLYGHAFGSTLAKPRKP